MSWTSTGSSHWEVFLEIDFNQKTSIDYKKVCSVMEEQWISTFCWYICQRYVEPISWHWYLSVLPNNSNWGIKPSGGDGGGGKFRSVITPWTNLQNQKKNSGFQTKFISWFCSTFIFGTKNGHYAGTQFWHFSKIPSFPKILSPILFGNLWASLENFVRDCRYTMSGILLSTSVALCSEQLW